MVISRAVPWLIRAVAVVDAPLPGRTKVPQVDPLNRLAVYSARAEQARLGDRIDATIRQFRDRKHPVTTVDLGTEVRYLNAAELEQLASWIDSLDRF